MSRLPVASFLLAVCATAQASNLKLDMHPLFETGHDAIGFQALVVDIKNDGPDAHGLLHISTSSFSMDYPVELPRGSEKQILTYPKSDWGGVDAELETDQGHEHARHETSAGIDPNTGTVLLIGDNPGALAFLKQYSANHVSAPNNRVGLGAPPNLDSLAVQVYDAYCTPAEAPPRPVGYASLRGVVLGTGSERLSDASVEALKLWTMSGGMLFFIGGASSPALTDPRWADSLPVSGFSPVTLHRSPELEKLGGEEIPGPFTTLQPSKIKSGTVRGERGSIISVSTTYGLGRITFLSFNPFEGPLNRWGGRGQAIEKLLRISAYSPASAVLSNYVTDPVDEMGASRYPIPTPTTAGSGFMVPGDPSDNGAADPFNTKLPPVTTVFGILTGYFILVVPINFFVLKKLKRGELAWFTAPVISLGAAAILFTSARGLYSAQMSTASQGVVVLRNGTPDGMFFGKTQMFLPQGGSYDLKMHGVDTLGMQSQNPQYYGDREDDQTIDLNPIDVGEIQVPDMRANNLAFREIRYQQKLNAGDWIELQPSKSDGVVRCTVTNRSPYTLRDAHFVFDRRSAPIAKLEPGESKQVSVSLRSSQQKVQGSDDDFFLSDVPSVQGVISGLKPGPQIGSEVEDRTSIKVIAFANQGLGANE
jgi:hypothetical protein